MTKDNTTPNLEKNSELKPIEGAKHPRFFTNKTILSTAVALLIFIGLVVAGIFAINRNTNLSTLNTKNYETPNLIPLDKATKSTPQNSTYLSSTKGTLELPWTADKVDTFHSTYYLFGNVVTDGDLFHVEVAKNGKVVSVYTLKVNSNSLVVQTDSEGSGFVANESSPHKKFYFPIHGLSEDANDITVKLYTDEGKAQLLDEKSFRITRKPTTYNTDVSFYNETKNVAAEGLFKQVGMNFDKEKLWEYLKTVESLNVNTTDFLYGKAGAWTDYSLELVGEISVNNSKAPLYRFFYTTSNGGPNPYNNAFYFYIESNNAYLVTNSLVSDEYVAPIYLFYIATSPYIFKDTVSELEKIDLDANNLVVPSTLAVEGRNYCKPDKIEAKQLYKYQSYILYDDYRVYDKYGNCRDYRLVPSYFKSDKYPGNSTWTERINPDFNKMSISMDDGQKPDAFYTPYWYGCGGSRGYRVLNTADSKYLEGVGKTSSGETVYIYSKNMPYPEYAIFRPAYTKDNPYTTITEENWQEFLVEQKETYPTLVIKNVFGEWVVYINANVLPSVGC